MQIVQLSKMRCTELHSCIENTPALVLDCGDVDLRQDAQARQDYSQIVRTYFEWVKACKEASRWAPQILRCCWTLTSSQLASR